jgi:predicted esterase
MNVFNRVYDAVMSAHAAGDYTAALRAAREGHEQLAGERVRTWYWQACLLSLLGDSEGAVAALEAGLEEGAWFNPDMLDLDPDLQAARSLPGLLPIRRECEERRSRRRSESRPECLVLAPSSALWDQQTLLVLHRRGDSARNFADRWGALVDEGWTLVVPQSSQPWDSAGWCWDDVDHAHREVRAQLEDCRTRRGLDLSRLVIAGASQGAPLAAETAQEAGLPWLCVIPSFPSGYDTARLAAVPRHTRGAFITGEKDPSSSHTRRIVEALQAAGASITTRTMEGVGHELPHDLARYASDALKTIALG